MADLFRITQDTIKHRLDEFRATPSAQLTLQQFHCHDVDIEFDPPSFIRTKLSELVVQANEEGDDHGDGETKVVVDIALPELPREMEYEGQSEGGKESEERRNGEENVTALATEIGEETNGQYNESDELMLDDFFTHETSHLAEIKRSTENRIKFSRMHFFQVIEESPMRRLKFRMKIIIFLYSSIVVFYFNCCLLF